MHAFPAAVTRRAALKAVSAGGLSMLLPPLSARAANRRGAERPKSLILIWLSGGPSQLETWDPHPGTAIGGETTAVETSLPGVQIASTYGRTAEVMKHFSVVRSLVSKEGDHERGTHYLLTGYRPDPSVVHASIGSLVSRELPSAGLEIPSHIALGEIPPIAFPRGGYLGAEHDAFRVDNPGQPVGNMKARVDDTRQARRLEGLSVMSRSFRRGREGRVEKTLHNEATRRALAMMSSEQLAAFETSDEPQAIRDAYGGGRFGQGCLVARRLVETGVRAVQVVLPGFDTHADNFGGHETQAALLDPALATLTQELVDRDLFASTAVLVLGEFGRTPRINPLVGRDHWPTGFSCLLGGGGLAAGTVIGETDPRGEKTQPTDPVSVERLYATVLSALGLDPTEETMTPIGRPLKFADGDPIARLLS